MGSLVQGEENCDVFENFKPLTTEEYALIEEVRKIIVKNTAIACTGCAYCTHDCPKNIAIPQYFALYNSMKQKTGSFSSQPFYYLNVVNAGHGRASDCLKCGLCEKNCPQHLPIREWLVTVSETFDKGNFFPVRK